jgi:hypothetical protein
MIAIDWSHTKGLTTFDGETVRTESLKQLLSRLSKISEGGESIQHMKSKTKSKNAVHPPLAVLEQGCPMSLIYNLTCKGIIVKLIDNRASEKYRNEHNIEKTDENDAKIIWHLANNGSKLQEITIDNKTLQIHDLYHQYFRYQKARVALQLMKKGHMRRYGSGVGESIHPLKSSVQVQLTPDLSTYDIAIKPLLAKEKLLMQQLGNFKLEPPPDIKGLGRRIWIGLMVTANPINFLCISSYLRFCGLKEDAVTKSKYNRHARMLYHMLAKEILIKKDPEYRAVYDRCKSDIALKHPDYTKMHIHNAALNRTATFLAKAVFRHCHNGQE